MAIEKPVLPSRYFSSNPFDSITVDDLRPMRPALKYFFDKKAVVLSEDNKVKWNKRPRRRFMQVYSIQFLDSENLDQIYGCIVIDLDEAFNRKIEVQGCHDIDSKGFIRLTGPGRPLWASDHVMIFPKLFRGNQPEDFFHPARGVKIQDDKGMRLVPYSDIPPPDRVGFSGDSLSEPMCPPPCDEIMYEDIETRCGTMRVTFAVLSDAADCYLTIKLLDWAGEGSAPNIYGKIIASDTRFNNDPRAKTFVFDRKREEVLPVKVGQYISLQRPMNVVSMGYFWELEMLFYHKSNIGSRVDDPLIFSEALGLDARCGTDESGCSSLTQSYEVSGKLCTLEVTVQWLPYWALAM